MPGELEDRPLEAEDGDSNVSYRPAGMAQRTESLLHAQSVAPTDPKRKLRPVGESEVAGPDDQRRSRILRTERGGPTAGNR